MRPLVLLAALVLGCSRYHSVPESETPECRGYSRPRGSIVMVASRRAPGAGVAGRVLEASTGRPIREARIVIDGRDTATSDSTGRFALRNTPSGRRVITVRSLGFEVPSDTVNLPLPDLVELEVRLLPAVLDGPCHGFAVVRVRKPWWKLW